MTNETTPLKSRKIIETNPPPIIKKNNNPHVLSRGTILGTIKKEDETLILEVDSIFSTANIVIENAEIMYSVEHLENFTVCLIYSFNRVLNEVKIINPFNVSKIYIDYLINNNRCPVKRTLDMDSAIEQEYKKQKE